MPTTQQPAYTRTAIILHWLIAIMIMGQLVGGKIMMWMDPGAGKYELFQLHKSFGIMILLLSLARLFWRLTHKAPALLGGMKPWERWAAKLTHIGFYGLMIGVPMLGWLMVSASPRDIPTKLFKTVPWPDFPGLTRGEALADLLAALHEYGAIAIALLLVLHIGAALKHHFVNKDGVLARMLPFLKGSSS